MQTAPHSSPKDYRFNYPQEIDAVIAAHPDAFENIFFVSAPWQTARSNLNFECFGPAWDKFKDDEDARRQVEYSVMRTVESSTSRAVVYPPKDMKYIVIFFPNAMNERKPHDMAFTFDHEVGHHLVPSGFLRTGEESNMLKGESAADAYASLRCLQRFGAKDGLAILDNAHTQRMLYPLRTHVKGDWIHLTTAVLQQIIADHPDSGFETMTPEETLREAEFYAQKFSPRLDAVKTEWEKTSAITAAKPAAPSATMKQQEEDVRQFQANSPTRRRKNKTWQVASLSLFCLFFIMALVSLASLVAKLF